VVDKFTSVSGKDLSAMFTHFEEKFKLSTKYPSNEGKYYKPVIDGIIVERVKECLMTLARTMIDPSLDVRTEPNKAVLAKQDIGSGELRLSPVAKVVTLFNPRIKGAVRNCKTQCTLLYTDKNAVIFNMCGSTTIDDQFCNAYFHVQATHDEQRGNMSLQSKDVSFILASCSKLKISGHEHVVQTPNLR